MEREQWRSRTGFILATVGSAIGLGNIWRFPYIAYENGGGAFFIPYLLAMLTAGIPFMILEFSLGHKLRAAAPKAFTKLSVKFEWLGWLQIGIAITIAVYYVVIIGWAVSYVGFSFNQSWGIDTNYFFFTEYLGVDKRSSETLSLPQWHIVLPMIIVWGVSFLAIFGGVKAGIERANKIMMPLLFIMVIVLILRVIFLPGAAEGLNFLFEPDFSKIGDPKVWSAAYGQTFFTLCAGFSIMIVYSSYLPLKSDINNNAFMTVFLNCGFSILAGILIFSVLGYMANVQDKDLTDVVSSGIGLSFVTIPTAINLFPTPYFLGVLFFLTIVVAGLSSQISTLEAITCAMMEKFGSSRKKTASWICCIGFFVSLSFTTHGGLMLLDIVDYFTNNVALLASSLIELIVIAWLMKISDIRIYANNCSEFRIGLWFELCLRFLVPALLAITLITNLYKLIISGYGEYESSALFLYGWYLVAMIFIVAIAMNLQSLRKGRKL